MLNWSFKQKNWVDENISFETAKRVVLVENINNEWYYVEGKTDLTTKSKLSTLDGRKCKSTLFIEKDKVAEYEQFLRSLFNLNNIVDLQFICMMGKYIACYQVVYKDKIVQISFTCLTNYCGISEHITQKINKICKCLNNKEYNCHFIDNITYINDRI